MSLTSFITMPDVAAKFAPLRPKLPRKVVAPLKAEPLSNHYMLVGTAFDYLLRFELQRRAPHAITRRWVAENAPNQIFLAPTIILSNPDGILDDEVSIGIDLASEEVRSLSPTPREKIAQRARVVLDKAKVAVAAYVKSQTPSREMQADLGAQAIRLAKLDAVHRASHLDQRFEEVDPEDV